MLSAVARVESLLNYEFKNRKLCEEALTHSSDTNHISNQTLEFLGDSALGLAISNYLFLNYRDVGPGALTALRAANVSTEKLARIAVKHKLYDLMRRNSPQLDEMVKDFTLVVERENEMGLYTVPYGGSIIKAPKVLADIVEAIIGAVFVDCNLNLEYCWTKIRGLLEPIITLENLDEQPITTLHEYCQKKAKKLHFQAWKRENMVVTNVFVNGEMLGLGMSEHQNISKLNAARDALKKFPELRDGEGFTCNGENDIVSAKHRLNDMCGKRGWPKPVYSKISEHGPAHERTFVASVHVTTPSMQCYKVGDPMPRIKDAENSAAAKLLFALDNGS